MKTQIRSFRMGALALCFFAAIGSAARQSPAPASPEALFEAGVARYRALDYTDAGALWTRALELSAARSAAQRAQLCESLGNVYFRQDRPLEAAAWFSAAIELTPRDESAWSNLEKARSKAGLEPADRGDLTATFQRVVHALSLAEAEWLALLAAVGLGTGIVLRALVFGRAANRWLALCAGLAAISVAPWIVRLRESSADPMFVVSTAGAAVLSEPRPTAAKLALLSAGAQAQRLESLAGWVRVQTGSGERGWVLAESLFALRR